MVESPDLIMKPKYSILTPAEEALLRSRLSDTRRLQILDLPNHQLLHDFLSAFSENSQIVAFSEGEETVLWSTESGFKVHLQPSTLANPKKLQEVYLLIRQRFYQDFVSTESLQDPPVVESEVKPSDFVIETKSSAPVAEEFQEESEVSESMHSESFEPASEPETIPDEEEQEAEMDQAKLPQAEEPEPAAEAEPEEVPVSAGDAMALALLSEEAHDDAEEEEDLLSRIGEVTQNTRLEDADMLDADEFSNLSVDESAAAHHIEHEEEAEHSEAEHEELDVEEQSAKPQDEEVEAQPEPPKKALSPAEEAMKAAEAKQKEVEALAEEMYALGLEDEKIEKLLNMVQEGKATVATMRLTLSKMKPKA